MYNWITLLHNRNEYNIANQLYFNTNIKTEKKKPPKTKKNQVQWTQIVMLYWQLHLLRYLAVCFIDMFLCLIFMVLGLFKFKFPFILFFAVMLIQMTKLCNQNMYIGQGRSAVFPMNWDHMLHSSNLMISIWAFQNLSLVISLSALQVGHDHGI